MVSKDRRRFVKATGAALLATSLAGCGAQNGDGGTETTAGDGTTTSDATTMGNETTMGDETTAEGNETADGTTAEGGEEANLRVVHASPDAPNVDVYVDDAEALTDVPFGAVSDYLALSTGSHAVRITAAGDADTVVFDEEVELMAADYTAVAQGELEESAENGFSVQVLEDDVEAPGSDTAAVRLVHLSPDAPAVDVTVESSGDAVFDGVAFGETATAEVPAGDYTLQVRGDTEGNDGDVAASFDVTVEGGREYTAFAVGYLTPDDEPTDTGFDLLVAEGA
jgi:hypothetical protein